MRCLHIVWYRTTKNTIVDGVELVSFSYLRCPVAKHRIRVGYLYPPNPNAQLPGGGF
jgi:hypothetical protein